MARSLVVYCDEGTMNSQGPGPAVFFMAGVVCPQPVRWVEDDWYQTLLKFPHAIDRKTAEKASNPKLEPDAPIGRAAWAALSDGGLPDAHFLVSGVASPEQRFAHVHGDARALTLAALLVQIVVTFDLGADDTLLLYFDRYGSSSAKLDAEAEAIATSLRWSLPQDRVPRLKSESWAKDPNTLVGIALTDLLLYNAKRGLDPSGPWVGYVRRQCKRMGLQSRSTVLEVPSTGNPMVMPALAAILLGQLHRVDWRVVLAHPYTDLERQLVAGLGRLEAGERATALSVLHAGVRPFVENAGAAAEAGITPKTLTGLLEAVEPLADDPALGPESVRAQHYLQARQWSHRGQPIRAEAHWSSWHQTFVDVPFEPALLEAVLEGTNARVVVLTDLEDWDAAEALAEQQLALIEQYFGAFPRVPARGRALGSLAQCRILARRRLDTVDDLLTRSQETFSAPLERSYALTWGLVALGRGLPCTTAAERFRRALETGEGFGWGRHGLENPYLRWAALEAARRPGVRGALPALVAAVSQAGEDLLQQPDVTPVNHLALRALGQLRKEDAPFAAAVDRSALTRKALAAGDMTARLTLRTVAAWYATTHSDAARTALRDARLALGRAGELLTDRDLPAGLRQVYTGFLGFDATDPTTAGEWVAKGGY